MPFSSMIQEMKGKIGAISLRGVLRFRPGGHAGAGRAPAAEPDEASREGCWAQLPFELLRMVLVRVEDQEPRWPARSAIVVCACVCRCWRAAVKIVRVPEASGKLTFPISQAAWPKGCPSQMFHQEGPGCSVVFSVPWSH
ncbi:tubby-like F-box protein 11 [Zea mays]|uniref:tubby-like F-box protein 11 n=1 Tax=Zea mays TaxID=4577 RepID=UPI000C6C7A30|nr:tubby-like F-box protein 11 [Zea mays]|eukprot:XP_023156823.1 tubby-like F-box protein 11 [Zea mays]